MKRTVQILVCLLLSLGWWPVATWGQAPVLDAANAFATRWQGKAGEPIKVPLYGNYAYRWEKADGTEVKAGVATVAGATRGRGRRVRAEGRPWGVKRIEFGVWQGMWYNGSRGTPGALLRVTQWGSVAWESFTGAFYGCANMNVAGGAGKPDLSGVASMHSAFEGCRSFNPSIGDWDVSQVTSMREMFKWCVSFNQPLEGWDVSKVTNMMGMFSWCKSFNQPLGGWTLSALACDEKRDHDLDLTGIGLDMANYQATLSGWAAKQDQLQNGVRVRAAGLWYNTTGEAARLQLVNDNGS